MLFSPRIRLKPLAQLCRRLAVATAAGLEDRRIWRDETERGSQSQRAMARQVSDALARGNSISDALAATGDYLPPLFKQMVAVGEVSGQLDRTYRRLAQHYEQSLTAKRAFLSGLAWPAIQFTVAAVVVGLLIWITAAMNLTDMKGERLDLLGFGLSGTRGLAIYFGVLALLAAAVCVVIALVRRGAAGTRSLERAALKIPVVGSAFQTLSMAQFTWALQLVLDTPMDLRKALPLALDSAGNDYYRQFGPQVARRVGQGATIHAALAETNAFPRDLIEAIDVGERSGMLAEMMNRQSVEYQERAGLAIKILAQALGYLVWLLVAGMIIYLIFTIFSQYTGMINSLTGPNPI